MNRNYYRRPHTFKKKQNIFCNKLFWLTLIIVFLLLGIVYFIYFSSVFEIKSITIEKKEVVESPGVSKVSQETIQNINDLASMEIKNRLLFWDSENIFLFNSGSLEKEIKNNNPQLLTAEVRKKWPNKINIYLENKVGVVLLEKEEELFLLDNNGEIFARANSLDLDLPKLSKPGYLLDSKEPILSNEELVKVLKIKNNLDGLNIIIDQFVVSSKDKLVVKTSQGWEIYLTLQTDLDWQLTKLKAVLEEKIPPEKRKDLEYIEVRFGNLAPFKYKD